MILLSKEITSNIQIRQQSSNNNDNHKSNSKTIRATTTKKQTNIQRNKSNVEWERICKYINKEYVKCFKAVYLIFGRAITITKLEYKKQLFRREARKMTSFIV